jgi:hypothetical protein
MSNPRIMIIDDKGVIWEESGPDAREKGLSIVHAVEQGQKKGYKDAIGDSWTGDLVLVEQLARIR